MTNENYKSISLCLTPNTDTPVWEKRPEMPPKPEDPLDSDFDKMGLKFQKYCTDSKNKYNILFDPCIPALFMLCTYLHHALSVEQDPLGR